MFDTVFKIKKLIQLKTLSTSHRKMYKLSSYNKHILFKVGNVEVHYHVYIWTVDINRVKSTLIKITDWI